MGGQIVIVLLCFAAAAAAAKTPAKLVDKFDVPHTAATAADDTDLLVTTRDGQVMGVYDARMRARQWRGIPYAEPPVNSLRWTFARERVLPWSGVRDGSLQPPGCVQDCQEPPLACPTVISEDCLYLNVYAPAIPPATPMPVMMFIHGGNFRDGFCGTPLYDGSFMANSTETVVVVINYRLGVLGFLASSNNALQGNYGLSDQRMALLWIQQNIEAFGGDPARVTLFGQSAGAVSTAIHMYAPGSAGLFSQAWLVSEPYGIPLRTDTDMHKAEVVFANFTNCASGNFTCYQLLDSQLLLESQIKVYDDVQSNAKFLQAFMPMTPMVDGHQVPEDPVFAFQTNMPRAMPFVQGNTMQEGGLFVYEGFNASVTSSYFDFAMIIVFGSQYYAQITAQYPVPAWQDNDTRPLMSQITTDAIFECVNRNISTARVGQAGNPFPTYYYIFDHPPSFASKVFTVESCWNTSCHGSDLPFIFHAADGMMLNGTLWNMTADEYVLSAGMTQYYTNFAHTGNPSTPSGRGWLGKQKVPVQWPPYDVANKLSMHFTPDFFVDKDFDSSVCDFWDKIGYVWEDNN